MIGYINWNWVFYISSEAVAHSDLPYYFTLSNTRVNRQFYLPYARVMLLNQIDTLDPCIQLSNRSVNRAVQFLKFCFASGFQFFGCQNFGFGPFKRRM